MAEEQRRSGLGGIGDGIRQGIGILNAFREAVEETLQEAVNRGDLTPERAKRAVQETVERLQTGLDEARDRLELVPRRDFDALREEVASLRERLERLEGRAPEGSAPGGIIITD